MDRFWPGYLIGFILGGAQGGISSQLGAPTWLIILGAVALGAAICVGGTPVSPPEQ